MQTTQYPQLVTAGNTNVVSYYEPLITPENHVVVSYQQRISILRTLVRHHLEVGTIDKISML